MNNQVEIYENMDPVIRDSIDRIVVEVYKQKKEKGAKTFLLTGCSAGCGTTTTAIQLSIALSNAGWNTILVDCDIRKGMKYKRLSEDTKKGLSDCLNGEGDCFYFTNHDHLTYLPCGNYSENPVRLLCSHGMEKLVSLLSKSYDFVIFDTPSISVVKDAEILFPFVDRVLLIAAMDETKRKNFSQAKLRIPPDHYMGVILNKVNQSQFRQYMKDYDYFTEKKLKLRYKKGLKRSKDTARKMGAVAKLIALGILLHHQLAGGLQVQAEEMKQSSVMVEKYSITNDIVNPGEDFKLSLDLKNCSKSAGAFDIMVEVEDESGVIRPVYGDSNQQFLESLEAGEVLPMVLPFKISQEAHLEEAPCRVSIVSHDQKHHEYVNECEIIIPVALKSSFIVDDFSASENAEVGSKIRIGATYKNQGFEDFSNVVMLIKGEGIEEDMKLELGDLPAGEMKLAETFVQFPKEGIKNLYYSFQYYDSKGQIVETVAQNFIINVFSVEDNSSSRVVTQKATRSIGVVQVVFVLATVAYFIMLVIVSRKKRNR